MKKCQNYFESIVMFPQKIYIYFLFAYNFLIKILGTDTSEYSISSLFVSIQLTESVWSEGDHCSYK